MVRLRSPQALFVNQNATFEAQGKKRWGGQELRTCHPPDFLVVAQFEIRVSTQSGPDESARSVGPGAIKQERRST